MSTRANPLLSFALCLMLALTGHSMAAARGASAATGQMEICIGAVSVVVYVDENGQPTAAPHICPDCVLAFDIPRDRVVVAQAAAFSPVRWHVPRYDLVHEVGNGLGFQSRAPPRPA